MKGCMYFEVQEIEPESRPSVTCQEIVIVCSVAADS